MEVLAMRFCSVLLLGAAIAILPATATIQAAPTAGQILSNTPLQYDTDGVYTVVALPKNYRSNRAAMEVVTAMSRDPNWQQVRRLTHVYPIVYGSKEFTSDWKQILPEVAQGKPVVLIHSAADNRLVYKETAPSYETLRRRSKGVVKCVIQCIRPKPKPKPEPEPEPEPIDDVFEPLPDVVDEPEVPPLSTARLPVVLGCGLIGAVIGWGIMFRRGMV
jgi:hypothetical protein